MHQQVINARLALGVTLELTTEGINGLIVRALSKKGLLYKDGRIHTGRSRRSNFPNFLGVSIYSGLDYCNSYCNRVYCDDYTDYSEL